MGKFVGGLITGSVLTLVGIGIAAAISDGSLSNPLDAWTVLSGDDDSKDDDEEKDDEAESDSTKDNIVDEATKTGEMLGRGLGAILNAAAAGVESFEKSLSEEIEENEVSSDEEDSK